MEDILEAPASDGRSPVHGRQSVARDTEKTQRFRCVQHTFWGRLWAGMLPAHPQLCVVPSQYGTSVNTYLLGTDLDNLDAERVLIGLNLLSRPRV